MTTSTAHRALAAFAALTASTGICANVDDRDWCVTYTDHFELVSDLPRERALELVVQLDRFRSAASALLPGRAREAAPPIKVIAFKRARDFATVFNSTHVAGFTRPSLDQSLLASGPDPSGEHLNRNTFHEYVHYLVRSRATLNLPIWYEEGFASYLSTLSIDPAGVVTVGRIPYAYLRGVLLLPGLSIPDVIGERFRLDPRRHDLSEVYGLAWAIVRFLHHAEDDNGERYASRLGDMLAAIDDGLSSEEAMESSLGLDVEGLKRRLRNYYDKDQLPVFQFRTETRDRMAFRRDCLDAVETRQQLAEVAAFHHPRFAVELYESILAGNPDQVDALVGLSRVVSSSRASELARKAYRVDPTHPAAIVRMAETEVLGCQSGSADCGDALANAIGLYTEALTSDRHRVAAAYGLGILSLYVERPVDALEYLRAAYARAPWSPQIHYYLGEAYGRSGEPKQAVPHLRKTAFWHPDESWRQKARQMLARLGEDPPADRVNRPRSAP